MRTRLPIAVTAFALASLAAAAAPPQAPPAAITVAAVPSTYQVGINDVINIQVNGEPPLDGTVTVAADGTINLPLSGTPVPVAGKTTIEIARLVEAAIVKDLLLVAPRANVTVALVQSKPVLITGAVHQGITLQALQPMLLLDALNRAGGSSDPGGTVTVSKLSSDGQETVIYTASVQGLNSNKAPSPPLLKGGEIVRVNAGGKIYVTGAVANPRAIEVDDSDPMTVRKAFTLAGEETKVANMKAAFITHNDGSGKDTPIQPIDLKGIINGTKPDVPLVANDILEIPTSGEKSAILRATDASVTIFTIAAGTLLVAH